MDYSDGKLALPKCGKHEVIEFPLQLALEGRNAPEHLVC